MQQRPGKPSSHGKRMNSRQAMDTHGSGARTRLRHYPLVPSQYRSGGPWVRADRPVGGLVRTPIPGQKQLREIQILKTIYSILLQNAESVALVSPWQGSVESRHQKKAIPVTSLKVGDGDMLRDLNLQCEELIKEEFGESCNFDVDELIGRYFCMGLKWANDIISSTTEELVLMARQDNAIP
uniref:Uncharacterized protein n=1 Tax=Quercus lobata TaxID=97700 RepID=A0A7N2KRB1_QUELO